MSILAEPRRKRKICVDPQNLTWKNDTTKFGHKMLQSMGWNEGQGLGLRNQGMTENIKLKANYTQKGIGADASNADRTWIAHHDEFSFLLEKLNAKKTEKLAEKEKAKDEDSEEESEEEVSKIKKYRKENPKSLEEQSKATKTRIHYKFTKMKDLTRYSEKDKSAVIGIGLKAKSEKEDETSIEKKTFEESPTVKNSAVSVNDYFAGKMAKFYAKKNELSVSEVDDCEVILLEEKDKEAERSMQKADKKGKRESVAEKSVKKQCDDEIIIIEDDEKETEEKRKRKAERKERKRKEKKAQMLAE